MTDGHFQKLRSITLDVSLDYRNWILVFDHSTVIANDVVCFVKQGIVWLAATAFTCKYAAGVVIFVLIVFTLFRVERVSFCF